jgi:hypothetical protein
MLSQLRDMSCRVTGHHRGYRSGLATIFEELFFGLLRFARAR